MKYSISTTIYAFFLILLTYQYSGAQTYIGLELGVEFTEIKIVDKTTSELLTDKDGYSYVFPSTGVKIDQQLSKRLMLNLLFQFSHKEYTIHTFGYPGFTNKSINIYSISIGSDYFITPSFFVGLMYNMNQLDYLNSISGVREMGIKYKVGYFIDKFYLSLNYLRSFRNNDPLNNEEPLNTINFSIGYRFQVIKGQK